MLKAKPKGHMVHEYEMYPVTTRSRSKFDRSSSLLTTHNTDYLIPIWYDFAYPGDTLILEPTVFSRLATQIVPFMDNVRMDLHFWCVPVRLVWEHWKQFNGERKKPTDSIDYLVPQIKSDSTGSQLTTNSIFDYFGIPLGVKDLSFNSWNFRAYNLVWNEWYRDENLQEPVVEEFGDTDNISNYKLLKRGKRKDYFTSCLPWPQKGEAVDLPLGTTAPVIGNGNALGFSNGSIDSYLMGWQNSYNVSNHFSSVGGPVGQNRSSSDVSNGDGILIGVNPDPTKSGLVADLSNAQSPTIDSFYQAIAVQRLLQNDARCGSRYIESILSHFGVKSPDARLQRPEFLGGGTFWLNLSAVPQTSSTNTTTPQGNLSSFGTIQGSMKRIVSSFTEHCIVFGVLSTYSDLTYQQGLDRLYSQRSRYDFYYPELCNLGEDAVLNKEIFAQGSSVKNSSNEPVDDDVFGYQERWSFMRSKFNRITGQMRSTAPQSLDVWHLAQDFSNLPVLNYEFIECDTPINRVIALDESSNTPSFITNIWFNEQWVRPMSVYSIPSVITEHL